MLFEVIMTFINITLEILNKYDIIAHFNDGVYIKYAKLDF